MLPVRQKPKQTKQPDRSQVPVLYEFFALNPFNLNIHDGSNPPFLMAQNLQQVLIREKENFQG